MKNDKKLFITIEAVLAAMIIVVTFIMLQGKSSEDLDKVSVIIQNSDDSQWSAFKYGLKMAAEDQKMEMVVVATEGSLTVEEEKNLIESEIDNGADAVIVQPVLGKNSEEMLKTIRKKVPVMLIEDFVSEDGKATRLPIVEPDNYAMGRALAEELLKDFKGKVAGKGIGILSEAAKSEAVINRERGFRDVMKKHGVDIKWSISDSLAEKEENSLEAQSKVDFVIALDDSSFTTAGECSAANNLHGALVYGIGNSTEAVYYLDTGFAECLIVPDEFNRGYQSFTEIVKSIGPLLQKVETKTVDYAVMRRKDLFSKENQEILFTMSQ